METFRRSQDIAYPSPVFIVGTYDPAGKPISWPQLGGHLLFAPPCVAVALRKATYTYGNIVAQGISPSVSHRRIMLYRPTIRGIYSGRDEDKFAALGLTPVKSELVNAPYVAEFPWCSSANSFKPSRSACTLNSSAKSSTSRPKKAS
jgi:flavin reductase (DIM6/NTAB) family NADH-FMN oxidoreductase RutF